MIPILQALLFGFQVAIAVNHPTPFTIGVAAFILCCFAVTVAMEIR